MMELLNIRFAAEGDIARIRQVTSGICEICGLESFAKTRVVTAVLEIARNALQYAGGGRAEYQVRRENGLCWLGVHVIDQGDGLPDGATFAKARRPFKVQSGGAGAKGMGLGLTGVQRLADRFDLDSSHEGTTAKLGFKLPPSFTDPVKLGERILEKVSELSTTDPVAELSRQNRELAEAMAERELLIDEVHHRTGNNLALITSFIQLSKRGAQSEETKQAMMQLEARVHSVAKVHHELQRANLSDSISLIPLLESVSKHAQDAFSSEALNISITVFGDSVGVSGSAAIDIGLIVNELITNAYKHAFEDRTSGRIDVSFERADDEGEGEDEDDSRGWVLCIKDDGVGLPSDEKPERSNSLGWRMIRAMSSRLSGTIVTGSNEGFFTMLKFPAAFAKPL
ncbi:MAG: ATP-binding protein [Alteraurantiacibacter sp.]